jgi:hypothetical protein
MLKGAGTNAAALGPLLLPGGVYRSGQRIGLNAGVNYNAVTAIAANVMYAWPIPMAAGATISGVALQIGTAVAATNAKLGLALSDPATGRPGALVAESPNIQNMNTAADAEMLALFSAAQFVPAGVAWGLCVFDGLAQPTTSAGPFDFGNQILSGMLGFTSIQGITLRGGGGATIRLSRAQTYASAFPATLTGWSTANAAPSSPVMCAVVA